jgi:hypothetical protein
MVASLRAVLLALLLSGYSFRRLWCRIAATCRLADLRVC